MELIAQIFRRIASAIFLLEITHPKIYIKILQYFLGFCITSANSYNYIWNDYRNAFQIYSKNQRIKGKITATTVIIFNGIGA